MNCYLVKNTNKTFIGLWMCIVNVISMLSEIFIARVECNV